ncbi:hypothetical protein QJS04_geneDACA016105 [Acorus gramineus]|uniref:Uncharacterized protein n=1 Tax=Acorus gramineus TaxID=55184 RepID=A0AAV9BEZ6_ACOGR|nr:hypothetical protein QJS04_geneDACA016105 [Acorus gramineus]
MTVIRSKYLPCMKRNLKFTFSSLKKNKNSLSLSLSLSESIKYYYSSLPVSTLYVHPVFVSLRSVGPNPPTTCTTHDTPYPNPMDGHDLFKRKKKKKKRRI